jgi:hypothetical protein
VESDLTIKPGSFNVNQVEPDMTHASKLEQNGKLYGVLAVIAYLVRHLEPKQNWPMGGLRTVVRKFAAVPGLSPTTHMAFPNDCESLPLWTMKNH